MIFYTILLLFVTNKNQSILNSNAVSLMDGVLPLIFLKS